MQSTQLSPWWIVAPPVITGLLVILGQILTTVWLSNVAEKKKSSIVKEIEVHKGTLNKQLEQHRAQLQAELQTRLYAFQTRFSLLHQKQAEAIAELFSLLARLQNDLQWWADYTGPTTAEVRAELFFKTKDDLKKAVNFYDEKRIYFNEQTGTHVRRIVSAVQATINSMETIEGLAPRFPESAAEMKERSRAIINDIIHPAMNSLERTFKELLAAEAPNSELAATTRDRTQS